MLYHFQIELSDLDRGIYESLDFRVALHPSENSLYLLSRILAYALEFKNNLEFSPGGLNNPDAPALRALGENDQIDLWIEIGNPAAKKLHKASKSARQVTVYTYKNPDLLIEEMRSNKIHRADDILIYAFDPQFLQTLETHLKKNNHWSLLVQEGHLDIEANGQALATELRPIQLKKA